MQRWAIILMSPCIEQYSSINTVINKCIVKVITLAKITRQSL